MGTSMRRAALFVWVGCAIACGARPSPVTCPAPVTAAPAPAPARELGLRWRVTGDGPALVLVHGNFDSLVTWDRVVPALAKRFRVVTLDLPGFGDSAGSGGGDLVAYAAAVARVMDAAGVERAVIVGNSFGGAVASEFAARFPARTSGLVLEDANFVFSMPTDHAIGALMAGMRAAQELAKAPGDAAKRKALRDAIAEALALALPHEGAIDAALIDHFTDGFVGPHLAAIADANSINLDGLPARVVAARHDHPFPVLVVWGADDPLIPVASAEAILDWMPDARLLLFGGTGHASHLEQPQRFAQALIDAFAAGGALPATDVFVADPAHPPQLGGIFGDLPRVELAILRATPAPDADTRFRIAFEAFAAGDLDAAAAAVAAIDPAAPGAKGYQAYLEGARHELRGEPSLDAYATALHELPPGWRSFALLRLARQRLTGDLAREVDAALATNPDHSGSIAAAQVDRALLTGRYADALALVDTLPGRDDYRDARRLWALLGAGDDATAAAYAQRIARRGEPAAAPESRDDVRGWDSCQQMLYYLTQRETGEVGVEFGCHALARPGLIIAWMPPPPLERFDAVASAMIWTRQQWDSDDDVKRDLGRLHDALAPEAATPAGATALARIALAGGDLAGAAAAIDALPVDALAQAPAAARLRFAIDAARGDGKAVAAAHALAAAHPGQGAWLRVEGTTLLAAGRFDAAVGVLARAVDLEPTGAARMELAWAMTGARRTDEARAVAAAVRRQVAWGGSWVERLPKVAPLVAALDAPPPPAHATPPARTRPAGAAR